MKEIIYKPLDEIVFSSIDVETTGLEPSSSRICEVACLKFQGGMIIENFATLINPEIPIPAKVAKIHHITDEMVNDKPKFSDVAVRLLSMLEKSVVVAHNAPFDISFLKMEFERIGFNLPKMIVIDTLEIARRFGNFSNNKLGTVAKHLSISTGDWHRALNDVVMAKEILEHFMMIFKKDGIVTLKDMISRIKG